ncbi:hypothetical protein [Streptomyces sp. ST2-7A]|uniref:hypothetical protein n=1 Tax=Streptomyces sp. ST2-7A TaxID=2907214 RepID=UPI001F2BAD0A|nr:hypothetical protein [Streptomyces sp. ST2-7A]MCE7081150.1 hypothetical protein [Streptomyces sp. ST2-7A]
MIHFASNATGWYRPPATGLIPGGQTDRLIAPVHAHLTPGTYSIGRQPQQGAVNVYLSTRDRYTAASERRDRASVLYAHGIASKGYRDWPRSKTFSVVTCPGPAHADEVMASGAPPSRIAIIGYPKLDPLFRGEVDDTGIWADDDRIRVLYAPTHGGGSERYRHGNRAAPGARATSWWNRHEVLSLLDPDTFQVVLAPHPRHSPGGQATLAQYVRAHVVVADGGSTIYEAMALGLPVVLTSWLTAHRNLERAGGTLLEATVYRDRLGRHADRPEDLPDTIVHAAEDGPSSADTAFIGRVLPPALRGHSGKTLADLLTDLDRSTPCPS